MRRSFTLRGLAALALTGGLALTGLAASTGTAQARPYDCERSGKGAAILDLLRTVQWVEQRGIWWGTGSDGVTEVSNVPPWLRPRFIYGNSNPDGSYTTYEYLSNTSCP